MHVHEEELAGKIWLIRIFEDSKQYGDPYLNAVIAERYKDGSIELKALAKTPTPEELRLTVAWARGHGNPVYMIRMKNGVPVRHEFVTRKAASAAKE